MTNQIITLQAHLNALSSDKNNSICTQIDYWLIRDVDSVEKLENYIASADHYELFTDVFGHEPKHIDYDLMSTDEILDGIQQLHRQYAENIINDKLENEAKSRSIQERKAKNKYKPNLAFGDLKSLLS